MKYCNQCFKKKSECLCGGEEYVEIDYLIYPTIYELNRKGYRTIFCCSGHEDRIFSFYLILSDKYDIECNQEYFEFEKKRRSGEIVFDRSIISPSKKFKDEEKKLKNTSQKKNFLIKVNYELYCWAKELPLITETFGMEYREFNQRYFDDYRQMKYNPVLLLINPNRDMANVIDEAFYVDKPFYCNIIGKDNIFKSIQCNKYKHDQVDLILSCGEVVSLCYEESTMIEYLFDSEWFITNMDGEYVYLKEYLSEANSNYYRGNTMISSLKKLFLKLKTNKGCNSVVFSNGECTVIFTNKPFMYLNDEDSLVISNIVEELEEEFLFDKVMPNGDKFYVFVKNNLLLKGNA